VSNCPSGAAIAQPIRRHTTTKNHNFPMDVMFAPATRSRSSKQDDKKYPALLISTGTFLNPFAGLIVALERFFKQTSTPI
jgi:hypothetical protein